MKEYEDAKKFLEIDILDIIRENKNVQFTKVELKKILKNKLESFDENLFETKYKSMLKNDLIRINKKRNLKINIPEDYFYGKIYFSPQNDAFVNNYLDESNNYFVLKTNVLNSLHEDFVLCTKTKKSTDNKKPEAKVIYVLERTLKQVIGTYMDSGDFGFVIPDNNKINRDIFINKKDINNAKSYDKVIVKISKYPTYRIHNYETYVQNPEGEITEVLGIVGEKGVDTLSIIKENEIREEFPAEVKKEASAIKTLICEEDLINRKDFRDKVIYTIDGIDAKDLDDAVCVEKINNGYRLGVHIADVSHYVKENGSIDREALERGTSVYLIDKVIPMLPKVLCNNVCSLNEGQDKLTLSCIMDIDLNGNIFNSEICQSIINSKGRLVYEDVSDYLTTGNTDFYNKYPEVSENLKVAQELYKILELKRLNRGSIEFGFSETKIELDDSGKTINISPYERGIANDMIEEFMLAANETVAKTFAELKIPFIYRVHTYPREEKMEIFLNVAKLYGININIDDISNIKSKDLQKISEELSALENGDALKLLLLQSMQQARYSNERDIHFGLATDYYTHFTSPIRRYPDLQIHRIIKEYLNGNINEVTKEKYDKITEEVSARCSKTERIADRAEMELDKIKIGEYIINNKDTVYSGYIKGFNNAGAFVVLDNSAEGFVKTKDINFNSETFTAVYKNQLLKLGTKVKIKPRIISKNTKEVLFDIIEID